MGGIIDESKTNCCVKKKYNLFTTSYGEGVPAPPHFGENVNVDPPDYYYMANEYSFMDANGKVIQQFKTYQRINSDKTLQEWGYNYKNLGMWLICDVTNGKWHQLSNEAVDEITDASTIGKWVEILNDVV